MERKQPREGHSLSEDHRGRDKSGYGKKAIKQGALTAWRPQRQGKVRTWKENDQARGTYSLETVEAGTSQVIERKQQNEGHSLSGDGRGREKVRT